jgi:hypothetical protein
MNSLSEEDFNSFSFCCVGVVFRKKLKVLKYAVGHNEAQRVWLWFRCVKIREDFPP